MSVHIDYNIPDDGKGKGMRQDIYDFVNMVGKGQKGRLKKGANEVTKAAETVSYTHLTLPTKRIV